MVYAPANQITPTAPHGFLGIYASGPYGIDPNGTLYVDMENNPELNICIKF